MHHFYFPQEWIELQKELDYHPECIMAIMRACDYVVKHPFEGHISHGDWETAFLIKLAAIAAYCEIVIDGVYTLEEISKLAEICRKKLVEKRDVDSIHKTKGIIYVEK